MKQFYQKEKFIPARWFLGWAQINIFDGLYRLSKDPGSGLFQLALVSCEHLFTAAIFSSS